MEMNDRPISALANSFVGFLIRLGKTRWGKHTVWVLLSVSPVENCVVVSDMEIWRTLF